MNIGDRLRTLREAKNFTQGEIEKRTGLLRTYVSRVENGNAVPSVYTLEKLARALESRYINSFMMGKNHPLCHIFRSARLLTMLHGAAPEKMHVGSSNFVACLDGRKKATENY